MEAGPLETLGTLLDERDAPEVGEGLELCNVLRRSRLTNGGAPLMVVSGWMLYARPN